MSIRLLSSPTENVLPHHPSSAQNTQPTPAAFIEWRLASIDARFEGIQNKLNNHRADSKKEDDARRVKALISNLEQEEAELELELVIVHKHHRFIVEDLQDTSSKDQDLQTAYIGAWRVLRLVPGNAFRVPSRRPRRESCFGARKRDVLPAVRMAGCGRRSCRFASMVGNWLICSGSTTRRCNGLFLNRVIEEAWDKGWVAVVPDETVEATPTEWKLGLLNDSVRDHMVSYGTRFRDLDGRSLRFLNRNRPARRYLYLRFVMAYLHAAKSYPNFKEKVLPSGTM